MKFRLFTLLSLIAPLTICSCQKKSKTADSDEKADDMFLVVGCYTTAFKSDTGLLVYKFDTINAAFSLQSALTGIADPSYLAFSPDENFLYAVSECGPESRVNALSFDSVDGKLNLLDSESGVGDDPCFIAVAPDNRFVVTADYTGGSISVFPIAANGSLNPMSQQFRFEGKGSDPQRQDKPHLHMVGFSADKSHLYATDLGTDRIYKLQVTDDDSLFLETATPEYFELESGSGPRHFTWNEQGTRLYVLNELNGMVNVFENESNNLTLIQSERSDSLQAQGSADIHISPNGRFLYASNRLQGDGLSVFEILDNGKICKIGYQPTASHPRNFVISPNGKYLLVACRDADEIQIFSIHSETGMLSPVSRKINVKAPVCLKFAEMRKTN